MQQLLLESPNGARTWSMGWGWDAANWDRRLVWAPPCDVPERAGASHSVLWREGSTDPTARWSITNGATGWLPSTSLRRTRQSWGLPRATWWLCKSGPGWSATARIGHTARRM